MTGDAGLTTGGDTPVLSAAFRPPSFLKNSMTRRAVSSSGAVVPYESPALFAAVIVAPLRVHFVTHLTSGLSSWNQANSPDADSRRNSSLSPSVSSNVTATWHVFSTSQVLDYLKKMKICSVF